MTDYRFSRVLVWDNLGGSVKVARNATVSVSDPDTGAFLQAVKSDSQGHVSLTLQIPVARFTGPNGYWFDVISPDGYAEAASSARAAADSATAARASADSVLGHSHILLDTDGAPYFDVAQDGTQVVAVDADGVPYFYGL